MVRRGRFISWTIDFFCNYLPAITLFVKEVLKGMRLVEDDYDKDELYEIITKKGRKDLDM